MQIKFPVTAIISILHRISGVFLFILLPWVIYIWHCSLVSAANFNLVLTQDLHGFRAFLLWLWLSAAGMHLFAGLRHIVMDCGFAEHLAMARKTAYAMIAAAIVFSILVGIWIW